VSEREREKVCVRVRECASVCISLSLTRSLLSVWFNDNTCASKDEEGMLFDYKVSYFN